MVKSFRLTNTDTLKVPNGKAWLLMYGMIVHVTGTTTTLLAYEGGAFAAARTTFYSAIDTGQASGTFPLFNTTGGVVAAVAGQASPGVLPILIAGQTVLLSGNAGVSAQVTVLEIDAL